MSDIEDLATKKSDKKFSPEEIKAKLADLRNKEDERRIKSGENPKVIREKEYLGAYGNYPHQSTPLDIEDYLEQVEGMSAPEAIEYLGKQGLSSSQALKVISQMDTDVRDMFDDTDIKMYSADDLYEQKIRKAIREMIAEELNSGEFEDTLFKLEQPHLGDKAALTTIQKIYARHSQGLNSAAQNLQEGVEKDLAAINKEAEHEVLQSKMEKIQALIDKKQSQISRLDEDEDMKDLTDDKKVKEISKDIKALEKAKAKLEKMMGKVKGKVKRKEIIDEMDNSDEIVSNIPKDIRKDALKRLEVDGEEIDSIIGNYQNISFNDRNHLRMWLDSKKESNPDLNSELGVEDQY
jgi:hypothetical protein